jgi:hypothetical protein
MTESSVPQDIPERVAKVLGDESLTEEYRDGFLLGYQAGQQLYGKDKGDK